ncbi:hypothetical protein GIB67_035853 [Kingdonia uniflora]|uniref:Uncharacterized protein n=1 Tax=Kingdonia uniflora TaxID=39325 RepID=A0A7J7MJP5_9MAGN|nr:hypothetical protein GIB67_035853 [Kingdonia uniflora]
MEETGTIPRTSEYSINCQKFTSASCAWRDIGVANALMVDDDVEVGREVNFNAISSEYGGDLLEWKKGEEKDNYDKKDVEEKVKSEEEEVQEYVYPILPMEKSKNGDVKVDDVVEEEDSEQPTVVTMVVAEVAKIDIVFFNQEEVVGKTYQASVDQTTTVSIEEQTLEVEKTEDEASQTKESKEEVEQNKEEVFEGKDDDDGNLQNKPDPEQLVLMESEVDVTSKKRHVLTAEENNESAFKMACRMNQLHAHLHEVLPGVLLESFIQRPISQDEKSQVDQVWSLRKDESTPEAKKGNKSTYMMIGEEPIFLNALCTLYPNQWLENEVIDAYIKALI